MDKENALQIAKKEVLTVIKVTDSITKPYIEDYAVIGFRNVEHLHKVMKDLEVMRCENAWTCKEWGDLWKCQINYDKDFFEVESDRFGSYCDDVDWNQWTRNEAKDYFACFLDDINATEFDYAEDKFAEMKKVVDRREEIYKKILALKDDEVLITFESEYFGTFKKESMDFQTDTFRYAKALS